MSRPLGIAFLIAGIIFGTPGAWAQTSAKKSATTIQGRVLGADGKPVPAAAVTCQSSAGMRPRVVHTDAKGHYSAPGLVAGTYNIDVKGKDKDGKEMLLYQTGIKLASGTVPTFDINLKELQEQGKLAAVEAERKRQEAEAQFQALKTHYDAGIAAIEQMKAAQTTSGLERLLQIERRTMKDH